MQSQERENKQFRPFSNVIPCNYPFLHPVHSFASTFPKAVLQIQYNWYFREHNFTILSFLKVNFFTLKHLKNFKDLPFSLSFYPKPPISITNIIIVTEDSFEDEDDDVDDEDDDKSRKNQNYFCFIDPTKILLQNVNREFLGNYSCRGSNAAGWGDESNSKLLNILFEPGNATISVYPPIPLKRKSMVLSCAVEDSGNPKATRFHWLRGDDPVKDIVTAEWTIDPVGLHSRNNFSCYAFNDGGNGTLATINIDVQVPPTFISKLTQYTGFLYSEPNISLSCRVECVPHCSIYWFRDGQEITDLNNKYYINEMSLAADTSTGDFESVLSVLVSFISISSSSSIITSFRANSFRTQ